MKVKCADCSHYELYPDSIKREPLGSCENEKICPPLYPEMYNGYNWRTNYRSSQVLRYCKGFPNQASTPRAEADP